MDGGRCSCFTENIDEDKKCGKARGRHSLSSACIVAELVGTTLSYTRRAITPRATREPSDLSLRIGPIGVVKAGRVEVVSVEDAERG